MFIDAVKQMNMTEGSASLPSRGQLFWTACAVCSYVCVIFTINRFFVVTGLCFATVGCVSWIFPCASLRPWCISETNTAAILMMQAWGLFSVAFGTLLMFSSEEKQQYFVVVFLLELASAAWDWRVYRQIQCSFAISPTVFNVVVSATALYFLARNKISTNPIQS